jgi:putative SOS response-associated peptidase YedK
MCGRAVLTTNPKDLRESLGLDEIPDMPPRYNIAPTQPIAVIRRPRKLELLRWGLVPHGAHTLRAGSRGINVRAETVARAPAYRSSFRERRCLVIVDGFYEWQERSDKKKQPFVVQRPDKGPIALAGIWDRATTEDGEIVESCGIITRASLGISAELHDRMPLILTPEVFAAWLDPATSDATRFLGGGDVPLVAHPVSLLVNSPANDGPQLVEPADAEPAGDAARHGPGSARSS